MERSRRKIISPFQDIDRKAQSENGKKIRPLAVQKENDREGKAIVDMLIEDGITGTGIESVTDRHTLVKIRFFGSRESLLEESQILLQADRGPLDPIENSMSDLAKSGGKSFILNIQSSWLSKAISA